MYSGLSSSSPFTTASGSDGDSATVSRRTVGDFIAPDWVSISSLIVPTTGDSMTFDSDLTESGLGDLEAESSGRFCWIGRDTARSDC